MNLTAFVFRPRRRVNGKLHVAKNWSCKIRMPWESGSLHVLALGTTDKREAVARLGKEVEKREKRRNGTLPPEQHEEAAGKPLGELLGRFLREREADGCRPTTLKKYANLGVLFRRAGWSRLVDVTEAGFRQWRDGSGLAVKTVNDALANLSTFYRWLQRGQMVTYNPVSRLKPKPVKSAEAFRRALSVEEALRLLAVAPIHRRAVYLMAMQAGLRRREMRGLRVGDLFLDTPSPFVRIRAELAKGKREDEIPVRTELVAALREIIPVGVKSTDFVFRQVPRISTVARDLRRAGIAFEDDRGRRVDLHSMRVTLATNCFAAGLPVAVVMQLMRHRDIKTTLRHYTDATRLPLVAAVKALPALGDFTAVKKHTQTHTHGLVAAGQK